MNTTIAKRYFLSLLLAAQAIGCGGPLKYQVASTPKAPGADAKIVADVKKEQATTAIELAVTNLAPPDRIVAGASHYVAWYRKDSASTWSRIGGLKFDDGGRKGELVATVPEVAFEIEVSAEQNVAPGSPSSDIVLAQAIGR